MAPTVKGQTTRPMPLGDKEAADAYDKKVLEEERAMELREQAQNEREEARRKENNARDKGADKTLEKGHAIMKKQAEERAAKLASDKAKEDKAKEDKAKEDKAKEDKAKEDEAMTDFNKTTEAASKENDDGFRDPSDDENGDQMQE